MSVLKMPNGERLPSTLTPYLDPQCKRDNLDLYIVRRGILRALKAHLGEFSGIVLDVGCGQQPYRSLLEGPPSRVQKYIGLDLAGGLYDGHVDLAWDGKTIPLPDSSIDSALATEVLEHCPDPNATLREIARVLKPAGFLFFTVPFMWPLHDMPYDEFRYTPTSLVRLLQTSGFGTISLNATGGWDASLAQMIGLWVRNRPMAHWKRRLLTVLAAPVVQVLSRNDSIPKDLNQYIMVPGFAGTALKAQ